MTGMHIGALILTLLALSAGEANFDVRGEAGFGIRGREGVPPIAEVQRVAIEHARLDPAEISSWKKRARMAPLLPKLQVSYDRRLQFDVNVDVNDSVYVGSSGAAVGPPQGSYKATENNDNSIGVKAIWSFNETIFNPDMLAVSEEARLLARERRSILAEVNKNYYEREKLAGEIGFLSAEQKQKPRDEKIRQEIFMKRVAIDESTAALDAMTGGWFGKQLRAEGRVDEGTKGRERNK